MLEDRRAEHETTETPMVISGCVGPRGDGYDPGDQMTGGRGLSRQQIDVLADTAADLITALTMNNVPKAIGLPGRHRSAVSRSRSHSRWRPTAVCRPVRRLARRWPRWMRRTGNGPAYFMINCAHPTHFEAALAGNPRIRGLRANASSCSHEELDNARCWMTAIRLNSAASSPT